MSEARETEPNHDGELVHDLCDAANLKLGDTWVIWYDTGGKKGAQDTDWETQMVTVGSFSTVVGLWNYWNAIDISRLPNGGNVRWMKDPIKPKWEDPANKDGGRLLVRHSSADWGEQALMDVLLWIVGVECGIEVYDGVCGFVFSRRRTGSRVEVWTRQLAKGAMESLAVEVQRITGGQELEYRDHKGSLLYAYKPPKKQKAPKAQQGAAPAIPMPLPRPRSRAGSIEVDMDALVKEAAPGAMATEAVMRKIRHSLQDEAEAAREAMASLPAQITAGVGFDDFTPCSSPMPSPMAKTPDSRPQLDLISEDGFQVEATASPSSSPPRGSLLAFDEKQLEAGDTATKGSGEECSLPGGLEAGGAEVVASEPARSPTSQNGLAEKTATERLKIRNIINSERQGKGVNLEGQTEVAKLAEEAGTSDTATKGSGEECSLPGGLEAGGAEVVASEPARSPTRTTRGKGSPRGGSGRRSSGKKQSEEMGPQLIMWGLAVLAVCVGVAVVLVAQKEPAADLQLT